jgi:hypothetical protein
VLAPRVESRPRQAGGGQQESLVGCLSRVGATDTTQFMVFDRELRSPVAAADPLPFVVLATFPHKAVAVNSLPRRPATTRVGTTCDKPYFR